MIVGVVVVGMIVFGFFALRQKNAEQQTSSESSTESLLSKLEIKRKEYFFTTSENAFYRQLLGVLNGQPYTILSKVRLLDLFVPAKGENYTFSKNKISQKHVDFVILAVPSGKVLVAFELDGTSHDTERQQVRDLEKDSIFRLAGLPLVRYKVAEKPDLVALKSLLEPYLGLVKKPVSA